MADKVMNITSLATADDVYSVGAALDINVPSIEKITFFSSLEPYNKNKCFEGPCYVITYVGESKRHIVPLKEVKGVEVEFVEKETVKKKTNPEAFVYETATKGE